jgi:hypothetical protein
MHWVEENGFSVNRTSTHFFSVSASICLARRQTISYMRRPKFLNAASSAGRSSFGQMFTGNAQGYFSRSSYAPNQMTIVTIQYMIRAQTNKQTLKKQTLKKGPLQTTRIGATWQACSRH